MTDDAPLFCPFCRECYEGRQRCPEHELPLITFEQLSRQGRRNRLPGEDEPVAAHELRFGRGLVLGSAVVLLVGLAMPLVTSTAQGMRATVTGYQVALNVAPNLWAVPAVGLMLLSIVVRRRTPRRMRGARLAVPVLALLAAFSIGYTLWRVHQGAEVLGAAHGAEVAVRVRFGAWLLGAAVLAAVVGGLRLGVLPVRRGIPTHIDNVR